MKNSKVLAIKYRPKKLSELVGQEIIAETIFNSLKLKKIPNAYLFHGIRGTGKTSIARIIAKSLNCEKGVENLCSEDACVQCNEINNSSHLDVIEQDCATATGIDSVRDLIEFCRYPPSFGKFKVLILDEIQAMSKAGAQSLLKILEEPPEYVRFIFCTTEIKKILVTMLSRCSRFDLTRVSSKNLFKYLKKISLLEKGNITDEALKLICKCSEGSVRDALSLLDRALLTSQENKLIDLKVAQDLFGHFDKSTLIELIERVLSGDEENTLRTYKKIYEAGIEPKIFLNEFLEILYYLKNINSLKLNGTNFELNDEEYLKLKTLREKINTKTLFLFWQITINNIQEIEIVSNQNIKIEMFLIQLIYIIDIIPPDEGNIYSDYSETYNNNEKRNKKDSLKIDEKTINQIKTTMQTEEFEDINNSLSIKSFNDLVQTCKIKKEMKLKYELETYVNLIHFENRRMEITFNEHLNKDFVKNLTTKLFEWTKQRWIITLSRKKGDLSIKQSESNEQIKLINSFKESDDYQQFMSHFEDSQIIEIENEK